ncbi:MAG: recombinase family protein, partial [Alphaproteobacteria bacterium]|nr:recombinase family protein [Alphaproteobacteria bacterium]
SRNREESILFKGLLRKHGVMVRSITENFDPDTPQGFLYEGMIEVINQFYSMNLATETLKGMREAAERGHFLGGQVPYGYSAVVVEDGGGRSHRELVPGPDEQVEAVRLMFRLAGDQGKGVRSVVAALNARGIPSPRGGRWGNSTVYAILRSRTYVGDLTWGKTKKAGRLGRTKAEQDRWIVTQGSHEPLVDRALFDRCQERLDTRTFDTTPKHHRKAKRYLLSGLIRCGHCGHGFVGRRQHRALKGEKKTTYLRYYCGGYLTMGRGTCASLPLDMQWVDDLVINALRARVGIPEALADLERRIRERIEARRSTYKDDVSELTRKIAEIDRKVANYYRAIGEGLDPLVCQRLIAEQEQRKLELSAEAEVLEDQDYFAQAQEQCLEELRRFGRVFEDGFGELPDGLRRAIVERFVSDIEVQTDDTLRIRIRVPFDADGLQNLVDTCEDQLASVGVQGQSFTFGLQGGAIVICRQNSR